MKKVVALMTMNNWIAKHLDAFIGGLVEAAHENAYTWSQDSSSR